MKEQNIIKRTKKPNTTASTTRELKKLGIEAGMVVLLHCSLSSIGWVCGGASALIKLFENLLGEEGTLVMAAHPGDLSGPSSWPAPPVPRQWVKTIKKTMPPFYKDLTPSKGMGKTAEFFRCCSRVLRSSHPLLHLAEYRAKYSRKKVKRCWAPILEEGKRAEKNFLDINLGSEDFAKTGMDYGKSKACISKGRIGRAGARLMQQRI
jgi:aminoglycoside 3-N-acetyltransferase